MQIRRSNSGQALTVEQMSYLLNKMQALAAAGKLVDDILFQMSVESPVASELERRVDFGDMVQMILSLAHVGQTNRAMTGLLTPLYQRISDNEQAASNASKSIGACAVEGCELAQQAEKALTPIFAWHIRDANVYSGEMDMRTGGADVRFIRATDMVNVTRPDWELLPVRLDLLDKISDGDQSELNWGYGGAGPTALSISLLAHSLQDDALARRLYREFKREVAQWPNGEAWAVDSLAIDAWVHRVVQQRESILK